MINPSSRGADALPFLDGKGLGQGQGQGQGLGQGEKSGTALRKDSDFGLFNNKYKYKKNSIEGLGGGGGGGGLGQSPTMNEGTLPMSAATALSVPALGLQLPDDEKNNDDGRSNNQVTVPAENNEMNVESFREVLTFRGDSKLSGKLESPKRRRISADPGMPGNQYITLTMIIPFSLLLIHFSV